MLKITQEKYETLQSVVTRTVHAVNSGQLHIQVQATVDDDEIIVEFKLPENAKVTDEELMEALRQEAERIKVTENMRAASAPPADDGHVPLDGERVPWSSLHPILREVVLATLRSARTRYALQIAEGNAQQIATLSAMNGMFEQAGAQGEIMAASMTEGMARSLKGSADGKAAVCAAYDVAISELEELAQ